MSWANDGETVTYRNRRGEPISLTQWADLWDDMDYRIVAEDPVGEAVVRTVWEGIDGPAGALYATGIRRDGSWRDARVDARTEPEALELHREVVAALREENPAETAREVHG